MPGAAGAPGQALSGHSKGRGELGAEGDQGGGPRQPFPPVPWAQLSHPHKTPKGMEAQESLKSESVYAPALQCREKGGGSHPSASSCLQGMKVAIPANFGRVNSALHTQSRKLISVFNR